jgi:hypothetical protein
MSDSITFSENAMTITDNNIISFFKANSNAATLINIFIEILDKFSSNNQTTSNNNTNEKILTIVSEINNNMTMLKSDIILKFHESKKEYMDDIKTILQNNILSNNEKINAINEKNNEVLYSKISEYIPKTQDKNYEHVENCIKNHITSITQDTTKLLSLFNQDKDGIKYIVENIDNKFNKMIHEVREPIFNYIKNNEDKTNIGFQTIKETFTSQKIIQENLFKDLQEHLNRYKNNSNYKGAVAERELVYLLQSIMPHDEVINVSAETSTCDCKLVRKDKDKPIILFESKNYTQTIPSDEVDKFNRDIETQKLHGIFISQNSHIALRRHFEINIINGLIRVYLTNVNYSPEIIKLAIDIVDNMAFSLRTNMTDGEHIIGKECFEDIKDEYRSFCVDKTNLIEMVKMNSKQVIDKLEEIHFSNVKRLLMKYGYIENVNNKCSFCNWVGKDKKASLSAHLRSCKSNPENQKTTIKINTEESPSPTEPLKTVKVTPPKPISPSETTKVNSPEPIKTPLPETKKTTSKKVPIIEPVNEPIKIPSPEIKKTTTKKTPTPEPVNEVIKVPSSVVQKTLK